MRASVSALTLAAALGLSSPSEASPVSCSGEALAEVLGSYDLTGSVLEGPSPKAKRDTHYFRLALSRKDCQLEATLTPMGGSKKLLKPEERQPSLVRSRVYKLPTQQPVLHLEADLSHPDGQRLSVAFQVLFRAPTGNAQTPMPIYGTWRDIGPTWEERRTWGTLEAKPIKSEEAPFEVARKVTPCKASLAQNAEGRDLAYLFHCGGLSEGAALIISQLGKGQLMWVFSGHFERGSDEVSARVKVSKGQSKALGPYAHLQVQLIQVMKALNEKSQVKVTQEPLVLNYLTDGSTVWEWERFNPELPPPAP